MNCLVLAYFQFEKNNNYKSCACFLRLKKLSPSNYWQNIVKNTVFIRVNMDSKPETQKHF